MNTAALLVFDPLLDTSVDATRGVLRHELDLLKKEEKALDIAKKRHSRAIDEARRHRGRDNRKAAECVNNADATRIKLDIAQQNFSEARDTFVQSILGLVNLPHEHRPRALVTIRDTMGSIDIRFGERNFDNPEHGHWVLHHYGWIEHKRTPESMEAAN